MSLYVVVSGIILSMAFAPHFALANKCDEVFETEKTYELPDLGFYAVGYKKPTNHDQVRVINFPKATTVLVREANGIGFRLDHLNESSFPDSTLRIITNGTVIFTNYKEGFLNSFKIPVSKIDQIISEINSMFTTDSKFDLQSLKTLGDKSKLIENNIAALYPFDNLLGLNKDSILWPKIEIKTLMPWNIEKKYTRTIDYENNPADAFIEMIGPIKIEIEPYGRSITITVHTFTENGEMIIDRSTTLNQLGHISIERVHDEKLTFSILDSDARAVIIDIISTLRRNNYNSYFELSVLSGRLLEIKNSYN